MKRKKITIQLIQNGIIILNNKEINTYAINSVDNYKVINKEDFIIDLTTILNKLKINQTIITNNVDIIIDNTYSELEKEVLSNIFTELSFNKIKFIELTNIFKLQPNEILIDISKNNIKIYYINEVLELSIYFNQYIQYLNPLLKRILSIHSIKTIKLFGNYCTNKKILNMIEKTTTKEVYIYSQPNLVPIYLLT